MLSQLLPPGKMSSGYGQNWNDTCYNGNTDKGHVKYWMVRIYKTGWSMQERHLMTHKLWNRIQRAMNGNRVNQLKIVHWNVGPRLWKNKLDDIEALLTEFTPDLCFISEANLWQGTMAHEMEIPGHTMILPDTMSSLKHARIVLLVRDGINVEKIHHLMDPQVATIWVKAGFSKKHALRIGGIYREHHQLGTHELGCHLAGSTKEPGNEVEKNCEQMG